MMSSTLYCLQISCTLSMYPSGGGMHLFVGNSQDDGGWRVRVRVRVRLRLRACACMCVCVRVHVCVRAHACLCERGRVCVRASERA